jgi:hypothetical protein
VRRNFIAGFLIVQILVPLGALGIRWVQEGSRPASELPFSFQMYSAAPTAQYIGRDSDGNLRELTTSGIPLVIRQVSYGLSVPERLCAADQALTSVERLSGPDPLVFQC